MADSSDILATDSIFLKNKEFYCKYMYNEIYTIEASGSYCKVFLSENRSNKLTLSITLTQLMTFLPSDIFIRTHRSYIVNIHHIERLMGNILYVGNCSIPIGREYKKDVYSHLNIIGLLPNK